MKTAVSIFAVFAITTVITNSLPRVWQPLAAGVSFFLFGLVLWPTARLSTGGPFTYMFVEHGQVVFSRYLMFWLGLSMLFGITVGVMIYH